MDKKEFDSNVNEILNALNGKASKNDVEKELNRWLQFPGVNINEAKKKIVEKLGGQISNPDALAKIKDLQKNQLKVNLVAKIVSITKREKEDKSAMYYGILGDETGTIPFTAWKFDINASKGDVIRISNGYMKEWNENLKLVIGNNTTLKLMPQDSIKSISRPISKLKIADLKPQPGRVEVTGKILGVERREVKVGDAVKSLYSGSIGDDSGTITFSSWNVEIKPNIVLTINGAYVKEFRNMPNLVIDSNSNITVENIDLAVKRTVTMIESLEEKGGADVRIEGIATEIKEGSGIVLRCNICKKILINGVCTEHGKTETLYDLRTKTVFDDGTGTLIAIFNRELTERLLDRPFEEIKKKAMENIGIPVITGMIDTALLIKPVILTGNVLTSDKGLTMFVKDFKFKDLSKVEEEAEQLIEHLRW